jgi:hypothetical protein
VMDQTGQPLPGVQVAFAVTVGGGSLAESSVATNAAGVAAVSRWTLGPATGMNTVRATVPGLPSVAFTATVPGQDACAQAVTYVLGATVNGVLTEEDCQQGTGEYADLYATTFPVAQAVTFTMEGTAFQPQLDLYDAAGYRVGFNSHADSTRPVARLKVFAPSGGYFLGATSYSPGVRAAYTLSSSALAGLDDCSQHWVVPGITLDGRVDSTDCRSFVGHLTDMYSVLLRPGETVTVRMRSTDFAPHLELRIFYGAQRASGGEGNANEVVMTYTHTGADGGEVEYLIYAGAFSPTQTGAYTLTVTRN